MNLTLDLPNRCRQHSRKGTEIRVREAARSVPRHGSHPFGSLATHSAGVCQSRSEDPAQSSQTIRVPLLLLHSGRLVVDASYINRVASGEHQSELSELGLIQAAA